MNTTRAGWSCTKGACMSMTEPVEAMAEPWDEFDAPPSVVRALPGTVPIVPKDSITGRSLTAVVAIMTFLASLTPGIAEIHAFSKEESARLVEPWLGAGLSLDDLPIPRLIVVKIAPGKRPDFAALSQALAARAPTSSLDDHRRWIDRMRTMAETAVFACIAVMALVWAVTVLSVTFATRGTMATNRPIVEVLHYVGATDSFIAGQFQRHFLLLGLKGGAIGGGLALLILTLADFGNEMLLNRTGNAQLTALFGTFSIGPLFYVAVLSQIVAIALLTAASARYTVNHTLDSVQ